MSALPTRRTTSVPAEALIDIEKATNGVDADVAPGPTLIAGEAVTWTYDVTNTGTVALINVEVTDNLVAASNISCSGGNNVVAGPILPGATFSCTASGVAIEGAYANTADVVGIPVDDAGAPITALANPRDTDPSNYLGVAPAIAVEKATNGQDADVATGPSILAGDAVTWTYVVTQHWWCGIAERIRCR